MKCPYCSFEEDKVIDSRAADEGLAVRRRRECLGCANRYTTYEKVEGISVVVVKKNRGRQPYERSKVEKSILRACEKRSCTLEDLKKMVDEVENNLYIIGKREITAEEIGDLIMKKLLEFDEVAYIRFASVYKKFKGIEEFIDAVNSIKK